MEGYFYPDGYNRVDQETCPSISYWVCKICKAQIPDDNDFEWHDGKRADIHFTDTHTNWHIGRNEVYE